MKNNFNIYIISDNHWLHENIIGYCKRPFKNVVEMNERMINIWNNTIRKEDLVISLGDIIYTKGESTKIAEILSKLNGRKVLVKGNHDRKGYSWYLKNGFDFICDRFTWNFNGQRVLFVHDPNTVNEINLKDFNYIIHGHKHEKGAFVYKKKKTTFVNVCVEKINYTPLNLIVLLNRLHQNYYIKAKKAKKQGGIQDD